MRRSTATATATTVTVQKIDSNDAIPLQSDHKLFRRQKRLKRSTFAGKSGDCMLLGSILMLIAFGSLLVGIFKLTNVNTFSIAANYPPEPFLRETKTTTKTTKAKTTKLIHQQKPTTTQFQRYTEHAPSCSDPINADDIHFTLVTQLSTDRLWMLEHHCQRWHNDMSVAVLTNKTLNEVTEELVQLGCDSTQLTVQILSAADYPGTDYPVNILRNIALSQVITSHVMYVDVDFWESNILYNLLSSETTRQALAHDPRLAVVIPAFQLNRQCREWRECPELNIPMMPYSSHDLMELIKVRKGAPFDPTNRGGHGSTLYAEWVKQSEGSLLDISCIRSNRYEPYLAFRLCHEVPPFQPAFSGYGKNKMTMVMHLRHVGYKFSQLGGAFVVHYPHLDSPSRMEWNEAPQELYDTNNKGKPIKHTPAEVHADWTAYKRGQVDAVFVEFHKWLLREVPNESRVSLCNNDEDDESKLWIDRSVMSER